MNEVTLHAWLESFKRAWEEGDPAQIGPLFTEDATYAEKPFGEPIQGRNVDAEGQGES